MIAPRRIVIVGAGVAGQRCAFELRDCGFEGEVVLVGAERHLPYDRTLLSKDYLKGWVEAPELALWSREEYEARGIELRLGTAAAGLAPADHELSLADGTVLTYDRLVIATGGRPVRPAGLEDGGAGVLRTLDDAAALRGALAPDRRLLVIGGGFVGAEIAATARELGAKVTIIEALSAPLARAVGMRVGERIADLHRSRGIDVVTDAPACSIRRAQRGRLEVIVADGRSFRGDVVLVGAGMAPATGWLAGSGIERDRGLISDPLCRTSLPDVLAAGDCARWYNPRYGELMHVEHWDTAGRHGSAAARSALGEGESFTPLPFFWSFQHGVRFQWVGQPSGWDSIDIEDDDGPDSFVAHYRRDGRLVATFVAGNARAIVTARRELEATEEVVS